MSLCKSYQRPLTLNIKSDAALGPSNFGKEGLIGVMGSAKRKCLIEVKLMKTNSYIQILLVAL